MKNFLLKNNKHLGFTLVETLVAVSIFSMTLVAVMTTIGQGISNTNYAKSKITAEYLAQEGIEQVRNLRDTYVLFYGLTPSAGWVAFNTKLFPTPASRCNNNHGCYLNLNLNSQDYADDIYPIIDKVIITDCSSNTCPNGVLSYNATTGEYGFSGTPSVYRRQIITEVISANETKIKSTVFWTQGSKSYNVSFSESLFNWVE